MKNAEAEHDALVFAERVLDDLEWRDLLYARVDLVADHGWALMELELVEPSLFLQFEVEAATRLALGNRPSPSRCLWSSRTLGRTTTVRANLSVRVWLPCPRAARAGRAGGDVRARRATRGEPPPSLVGGGMQVPGVVVERAHERQRAEENVRLSAWTFGDGHAVTALATRTRATFMPSVWPEA